MVCSSAAKAYPSSCRFVSDLGRGSSHRERPSDRAGTEANEPEEATVSQVNGSYSKVRSVEVSKGEIDRLGRRLRSPDAISPDDLHLLQEWRAQHQAALDGVTKTLQRELSLVSTSRVKTIGTTLEKLQRMPTLGLSSMQDIAGTRVVVSGGRLVQDDVAKRIVDRFADHKLVDRRQKPVFGYRAVHVVVTVERRLVEIQVRTDLQDAWANFFERLADSWGRQIRYGQPPTDPDVATTRPDGELTTRRKVLEEALDLSNLIDDLEGVEADSERRKRVIEQIPRSRFVRRSPSLRKVPMLLWAEWRVWTQNRRERELDQEVTAMKDEILRNLQQQKRRDEIA